MTPKISPYVAKIVNSSGVLSLKTGEIADVWVEFQNMGTEKWDSNTHLGTWNTMDRSSKLYSSTWLGTTRPAGFQKEVMPGEIVKLNFAIMACNDIQPLHHEQ